MAVPSQIVVQGPTVVFDCKGCLLGTAPQELRETLESHMDLEDINDGTCIGTATFPTDQDDGTHTSFSIKDEYKQHSVLF